MLNELFDKTKILRKVQDYLEENVKITIQMEDARTMEEMKAYVEKLTEANEKLLNYLQSETIALAEKSINEDPMSLLGVIRQSGE